MHFIIDGNNLIGKIPALKNLQRKNPLASRENLVLILERFFAGKRYSVTLHLDGHTSGKINFTKGKIKYSNSGTADENIKREIDNSRNPKLITVVSSDHSVYQYAKLNACTVIKSEQFAKQIKDRGDSRESEEEIQRGISNDEMKRLFGA